MASKLTRHVRDHAETVLSHVAEAAQPEPGSSTSCSCSETGTPGVPLSFRLSEFQKRRIKALFAARGLSLSAGCAMAVVYLAELVEAGTVTLSEAGIIDLRGQR